MSSSRPEDKCAELEEKLRLLSIENDHLAERAEETLLLGLIAENINVSTNVDALLRVITEQISVLKGIPYVGCFAVEDGQAWVVHEYLTVPAPAEKPASLVVAPRLWAEVQAGGCCLSEQEREQFPLRLRAGTGNERGCTILLPLRNRHGRPLLMAFAVADPAEDLEYLRTLLARVVEMVGARVENLVLLDQLTHLNEDLDQKVQERTEELRASESRQRALFEGANDAFFLVDADLNIRDVNHLACENLGYSRAELLSMKATDVRADAGDARVEEIAKGAAPGVVQTVEARHRRKDGLTFPVEVRVNGLEIDGEPMMLAQARDVSERNRLLAQLHQAQKMEAVGRLAGGIAHDFNNILTAIMGQLDLLKMDLAANPTVLADLELIQASSERAAGLTRQLLAFSRKQVLDMQRQDLSACVRETSRMLLRVVDETVDLTLNLSEEPGFIFGDQVQIEQILMNLVINARDAMPEGGRITIALRKVAGQSEDLPPHPDAPPATGDYLQLRVTDTGTGIPPEIQEKVFDPFFTTKEVGQGTGLGLALVYSLAEQHHARVRLQSAVGQGTTFELLFPEIESGPAGSESGEPAAVPRGNETILLVEDDQTIRSVVARMVEHLGYELVTASDGVEAVAAVEAAGGGIDLVLTDVIMPRMGGVEMVRELRERYGGLRAIYMSGYTDDKVGRVDLRQPGTRFLQKPVSFAALASELRSLLDQPLAD